MPDPITVEYVDPDHVLCGSNIRLSPQLDAAFLESVRTRGVLSPCPAVRTTGGQIILVFGSRRRAAAAATGQLLPVFITGDEDTTRDGQVARLFDQFDENHHREALTAQEQASFVQALLDFKVPEAQIRKRTGWNKTVIGQARKVAGSGQVMAAPPIADLEMAGMLADFEAAGDTEGQFRHAAKLLTDSQPERFQKRDLIAELTAAGVTVLAQDANGDPVTADGVMVKVQQRLLDWKNSKGKNLTPENHADCPGHAAYLYSSSYWRNGGYVSEWRSVFVCLDPDGNGHKPRFTDSAGKNVNEGQSKSQADATRQRRVVIENNKKWRAARTVRQNWLKDELLARRTVPDGALPVIFGALTGCWFDRWDRGLSEAISGGHGLACDLLALTVKTSDPEAIADALRAASPARQQVIALALVLAAWESRLIDDTWRRYVDGTPEHQYYRAATSIEGHYLLLLQSWGYGLSDIEKLPAIMTQAAIDTKDAKSGQENGSDDRTAD